MELGLCIETVFTSLAFEDRFKAAADAGFTNVEFWFVKDLSYSGTPDRLAHLAASAGVRITNTVIGSPDGSIGGGLTDPSRRAQWLERAQMTLEFNQAAGIAGAIVCSGTTVPGLSDDLMRQSVLEGLKATIDLADNTGSTLLLEPLNVVNHPGCWLTGSDRGAELCRKTRSPRMKLLFDCYHMQVAEGDLAKHITQHIDIIGHFHAAGAPGRHELFDGQIDYPAVLRTIRGLGYGGVFALEYLPSLPHAESLRKTLAYLRD